MSIFYEIEFAKYILPYRSCESGSGHEAIPQEAYTTLAAHYCCEPVFAVTSTFGPC